MLPVSSERLAEIIAEEVRRALAEQVSPLTGSPTCPPKPATQAKVEAPLPIEQSIEHPVVVVFNGASHDIEPVVEQLVALRASGVELAITACRVFASVHDVEALAQRLEAPFFSSLTPRQSMRLIHQVELLIWAGVSENTTNRLALGLVDTLQSDLISRALRIRRPVLANAPDLWARGVYGHSRDPQENLFRGNYATLERWGIETAETPDLAERAEAILASAGPTAPIRLPLERPFPDRVIITLADIEDARRAGQSTLNVPPGAQLTDLARELAERGNMKIVSEESE